MPGPKLFLDTSALSKRYIRERGTDEVIEYCKQASEIVLGMVSAVELISALNRHRREGKIPPAVYRQIKKSFSDDLSAATVVPLSPYVIRRAVNYLERAPLKSLDAIQLASAKEAKCELFLTADGQQFRAGRIVGIECRLV